MNRAEALLWRLLRAADRACIARAEAQWTNGYRSAREDRRKAAENVLEFNAEGSRLYAKEQQQWKHAGRVEGQMRRVFQAVLRDARKVQRKPRAAHAGERDG